MSSGQSSNSLILGGRTRETEGDTTPHGWGVDMLAWSL